MRKLLSGLTTALLMLVMSAGTVLAGDLSVRVEQPDSPTNQNEFDLVFVSLDIQNRPITVHCYKKGPSDGGFNVFDSGKNLSAGGGSDKCRVDGGIVSEQGNYEFYVKATAGGDEVNSSTVGVDYDTSSPETPTSYSRESVGSCNAKIRFRTADDGQTVKVEIYRSESTSFTVGDGTRIGEVAIGPNQDGEYTDNVSDCNKTYYYAIRAFNNVGNASSPVGDTTLTFSGTEATVATGAIPVAEGTSQVTEGSILGDETETDAMEEGEEGDVMGAGDEAMSEEEEEASGLSGFVNSKGGTMAIILGALLLIWYFFFRSKSK